MCSRQQEWEYIATSSGSVKVDCNVEAYPSTVTFTWALKRTSDSAPMRLRTLGRDEGLTGRYTLNQLKDESVELWCYAKNAVGSLLSPCIFTIYTQGRPGPVTFCGVTNHTASGFVVQCRSKPLRSLNTQYTLLVYAQKHITNRISDGVPESGSNNDKNKASGKKTKEQQGEKSGGALTPTLGYIVRNVTAFSPYFVVGGLNPGQEFALVISVSNEEGVSPPVVLSAFTLKDNAQTVIGMPSGGGRSGTGTTGSDGVNLSSANGGLSGNGGGMTSGNSGMNTPGTQNNDLDAESKFNLLIPPMIIVLVASVGSIVVIAILIIIILKRRGRTRSREGESEQSKLSEENLMTYHPRTPECTSREMTGSNRKLLDGSEGDRSRSSFMRGGSSGGGPLGSDMAGGGGGNSLINGGGGGGSSGGGGGGGGGVGGNVGSIMIMCGDTRVSTPPVMLASVDGGTFGSCNGDLLTTTSCDSLLSSRAAKQGELMESFTIEDTTLPILGIQKLGESATGHIILEGLKPIGSPLRTSCSSFRSTLPMTGMGTLGQGPIGGVSTMTGTDGGLMNVPSASSAHLMHVAFAPESIPKDRCATPGPRGTEGVSVL